MGVAFNTDLILLDIATEGKWHLLETAADNLFARGYVKPGYKDAVIAREKVFATGLPTLVGGVAIPHTDTQYVEKPAISFVRIKEPVEFVVMGDDTSKVMVNIIFMLAMKEEHSQLTMLQNLMGILQDKEALEFLQREKSKEKICEFIKERLNFA